MPKMTDQEIRNHLNRWNLGKAVPFEVVTAIGTVLTMSPEERIMVLDAFSTLFCLFCGRDLAPGDRCHCNNDE